MFATWKTVRVFISSTFRDMQAERDHLVRFVFARLREELLSSRIHLVDVDLRWGVTSEQDATEVCREVIDECRPRFLCMLGGRYGWVPPGRSRSITADEVYYGVLDQALKDRGFAYFYFRDDAATAAMVETTPGELREPQGSDNQNKLAELKQAIAAAGLNPFTYPAQWDHESRRLTGLKEFGDRVYDDLLGSMKSDPELMDRFVTDTATRFDEFVEENAAMESFVEERSERFVLGSRENVLEELLVHASATGGNGYICLTGAPGSGKSALIAHLSRHSTFNSQPSTLLIRHLVGASPGSTDVRLTLRRFCHELKAGCPDITADIPDDPEKLRVAFPDFLRQACARQRVVILLDAVNQFDPASHSAGLHWLPEELPDNARLILSALDGPALEELRRRRRKPREIELQPLTAADGEAIIEQFRKRYRKKFEPVQRAALLAKTDADTPLYLLAALEELRTLGTYEEITRRISELPPTTHELFAWILERLENDNGFRDASGRRVGSELVSSFAALLAASRHGLSQRELADLLDAGDPQGNVAALLHLLRSYLMRRSELLDFYHGQFRASAAEVCLKTDGQRQAAHAQLASYFHSQENFLESLEAQRARARRLPPTPRPVNRRKAEELIYQQLNVLRETPMATLEFEQVSEELENLLTDLFFLEAKSEADLYFELARDFSEVIAALPEARPFRRVLRLLEEAIRRDIHFIARHPTTFFQCMWNSCWWYDCPEAARHYDPPESGWLGEGAPWARGTSNLAGLVDGWRKAKERMTPGFFWMRSLRPPPYPLHGGQYAVTPDLGGLVNAIAFSLDSGCIASSSGVGLQVSDASDGMMLWNFTVDSEHAFLGVAFSPDGRSIASGDCEGTVRVWDAERGQEIQCLVGHEKGINCVAFSLDGYCVVSGSEDGTIRLWDVASGREIRRMKGHDKGVHSVAFSPDGRCIASGGGNAVRLWDVASGREIRHMLGHEQNVNSIAFSPDGHTIASGSFDQTARIWDTHSGEQIVCLERPTDFVHEPSSECVAFSPDGRWLATGAKDWTVRIWDITDGNQLHCFYGAEGAVLSVAFSPDGRSIASGGRDRKVRIWDVARRQQLPLLHDHQDALWKMSFSPDGSLIATGAHDRIIRIWDVANGTLVRRLEGHGDAVGALAFSPDSRYLVSGSRDGSVRVWEVASGRALVAIHTAGDVVAFSPDGQRFASASEDGAVRIWHAGSRNGVVCLNGHKKGVKCLTFSPDGTRILSASWDETVRLWDTESGGELGRMNLGERVSDVAFLPDGQRIAVSLLRAVGVWDLQTGERVLQTQGTRDIEAITSMASASYAWAGTCGQAETRIDFITSIGNCSPAAWVPSASLQMISHPASRTWALGVRFGIILENHFDLFRLEGDSVVEGAMPIRRTVIPLELLGMARRTAKQGNLAEAERLYLNLVAGLSDAYQEGAIDTERKAILTMAAYESGVLRLQAGDEEEASELLSLAYNIVRFMQSDGEELPEPLPQILEQLKQLVVRREE